jgi:hypothetical protein
MSVAGSALTGRRQCDPHTLKAMAAGLKQAVAADAPVVRDVPSKKLGDIVVEERDDRVYAQMDIGPVLLRAAGADISKTGSGGPIWTQLRVPLDGKARSHCHCTSRRTKTRGSNSWSNSQRLLPNPEPSFNKSGSGHLSATLGRSS